MRMNRLENFSFKYIIWLNKIMVVFQYTALEKSDEDRKWVI